MLCSQGLQELASKYFFSLTPYHFFNCAGELWLLRRCCPKGAYHFFGDEFSNLFQRIYFRRILSPNALASSWLPNLLERDGALCLLRLHNTANFFRIDSNLKHSKSSTYPCMAYKRRMPSFRVER